MSSRKRSTLAKQTSRIYSLASKALLKFSNFLGSDKFFWLVIVLFVLQASWVALSMNHSGFYDEQFHYGAAQFYSESVNPFRDVQEEKWDVWGDLTRHPSYLYYYFLGKIINVLDVFGLGYIDRLIVLRFTSVAFFAIGLYVYRKVLLSLNISKKVIYFSLLFFTLIPVVPLIAGQINYDNPLFLVSGLFLHQLICLIKASTVNIRDITKLCIFGTLGALIKFSFLPLLFAGFLVLISHLLIKFRKRLFQQFQHSWFKLTTRAKIGICILLALCGILLSERYIENVFHYGAPWPDCAKSLDEERCEKYVTWKRNHLLELSKVKTLNISIPKYIGTWGGGMIDTQYNLAFMTGVKPDNTLIAVIKPPLPVVYILFQISVLFGVIFLLVHFKNILNSKERILIFSLGLFFILILLLYNYSDYQRYGVIAATNGRYLFPVLLIFIALCVSAIAISLRKVKNGSTLLAIFVCIALTQGGGAVSITLQAEPAWYWQSQTIQSVNAKANSILAPLVKEE